VKGERRVLGLAMVLPTAAALVYFIGLSSDGAESHANLFLQSAYGATKVVQLLIPVVWLAFADRPALKLPLTSFWGVPTGLAFGVAVAVLIAVLYRGWLAGSPLFDGVAGRIRSKVSEFGAGTPAGFLAFATFLCVVHSLLEEYYWRWFVYGRLRRQVRQWAALVGSGLAFMAHHVVIIWVYFPGRFWPIVVPFSLGVAIGGIVWAWLYERTGSLLGPWVSHLLVDAALMAVGYELAFGKG
jgi:membrane protease YdiL (CAAX protease family)